jgi:hypothetical protein
MAIRVTTDSNPWHYTESGLDNVYVIGIEVDTNPKSGIEEPIFPRIRDLHDCIFLELLRKKGPLTGEEVEFLRSHFYWPHSEAAKKIQLRGARHFADVERKGKRAAFDTVVTDFVWRLICARAFRKKAPGRRKAEAARILKEMENVEQTLNDISRKAKAQTLLIECGANGWGCSSQELAA